MLTHVTLGLDMTLRDEFKDMQSKGFSWEPGKVFPAAAILGPWVSVHEFKGHMETEFFFSVNHELRQKAKPQEMLIKPEEILHQASSLFEICDGDILMTGTPTGVAEIKAGDTALLRWGPFISYEVSWVKQ
jgi:2-keto-4-pentenoate hydratase/2-oxohepta-3-ene-1,7-dioic acid hydratase in catechol pathway